MYKTVHAEKSIRRKGKLLKQNTLIIGVVIVIILALAYFGTSGFNLGGEVPGNVFTGRVSLNVLQEKRVSGASYGFATSVMRIIHGTMDYNAKLGEFSSNTVTGSVTNDDKNTLYLVIDQGNTTARVWLDEQETLKQDHIVKIFGADGDRDGFNEEYVQISLSGVPMPTGYETRNVDVHLITDPGRAASVTLTSLTNATGISTSAYGYKTASGYLGGFSEGDLGKIAKIELTVSTSGTNETYPDNEYWKLTHLKLGPYTFTSAQFGAYDLSNTRWQLKFGDQVNSQGGKDLYYEKNAGDLWCQYELKAYTKFPAANVLLITINIYFYDVDGTLSIVFNQVTSWTAT